MTWAVLLRRLPHLLRRGNERHSRWRAWQALPEGLGAARHTLAIQGHVAGSSAPNGAGKTTCCGCTGMLTPTRGTITVLDSAPQPGKHASWPGSAHPRTPPSIPDDGRRSLSASAPGSAAGTTTWHSSGSGRSPGPGSAPGRCPAGNGPARPHPGDIGVHFRHPRRPVASLDPLARREFLQDLMEAKSQGQRLSVLLSSHLVADLERVCDYLVIRRLPSRVAGEVSDLLASSPVRARRHCRHLAGGPGSHHRKPHRQAEQPAGPHGQAGPRPGLGGEAGQPGGPGAGHHEPEIGDDGKASPQQLKAVS